MVLVIPNNAAFPKLSVEVTSACPGVLHALGGIDDFAIYHNAVRHMRVTCLIIKCRIIEYVCIM